MPPHREPGDVGEPEALEELPELDDATLIAQQASAHLPQQRVSVSDELRSVVVVESSPHAAEPPSRPVGEATLVIRDRRALDRMFEEIAAQRQSAQQRARTGYVWVGLAVLAVVLGGVIVLRLLGGRANGGEGVASAAMPVAPPAAMPAPTAAEPAAPEPSEIIELDDPPPQDEREPRAAHGEPAEPAEPAGDDAIPPPIPFESLPLER